MLFDALSYDVSMAEIYEKVAKTVIKVKVFIWKTFVDGERG